MKPLNLITLLLIILGGLNWGLVGLFNFNLVAEIFGSFSRLVYVLVGLSALYQLIPFSQAVSTDEVVAESSRFRRDL
jgi:uncharacterized membrane protein YuzA (DUF378 family)